MASIFKLPLWYFLEHFLVQACILTLVYSHHSSVCMYCMECVQLTISILENDAIHVSMSPGALIHQPERLHLGVHKPAFVRTAKSQTNSF